MMEAVFCPVCLQNMSNSGRNKCDHHALPVFFTCQVTWRMKRQGKADLSCLTIMKTLDLSEVHCLERKESALVNHDFVECQTVDCDSRTPEKLSSLAPVDRSCSSLSQGKNYSFVAFIVFQLENNSIMNRIPWPLVYKAHFESNTSRSTQTSMDKTLVNDHQHLQALGQTTQR